MQYTLAEMKTLYSVSYSGAEIRAYWESCRPAAKARAKVKPQFKVKAQAKVKAGDSGSTGRQPAEPEEVPQFKVKGQAKVKAGDSGSTGRQPAEPEEVLKRLEACKVVPVIKVDDAAHAKPLVSALLAGGIDVAEITFRTACAAAAIHEASAVEGVCVGAGTVLEPQQVDEAVDMGADF